MEIVDESANAIPRFSAKSQLLPSYPTLRGRVSGAAAEEPPSESRRTILFRCYPQPSQDGAQAERGIGLREPAQDASGSELGAVEVGVEAGRAKGIDWDTRHLLGERVDHFGLACIPRYLALFHLLPFARMRLSLTQRLGLVRA